MARGPSSATFTTEFGHELEIERIAWLRRRFLWYLGFGLAFGIPALVLQFGFSMQRESLGDVGWIVNGLIQLVSFAVHAGLLVYVWRTTRLRWPINTLAYAMIVGLGSLAILTMPVMMSSAVDHAKQQVTKSGRQTSIAVPVLPGGKVQFGSDESDKEEPEATPPKDGAPPEPGAAPAPSPSDEASASDEAARKRRQLEKMNKILDDPRTGRSMRMAMTTFGSLWAILVSHFMACVFLPWTSREALRPAIPLLALNTLMTIGYSGWTIVDGGWSWPIVLIALGVVASSFLVPLPGLGVCWWRHGRFRKRKTYDILRGRYSELKHELTYAQQIHEGLFPDPIRAGPVRFEYVYEPMRQIGGDYLHAFAAPDGRHSFVVMDVTGHGIPAALTVNRLHGELTRIFAEDPDIAPGEVLTLLNRYVHLTLATHSVYVTAICFRVCAVRGTLEYASGGHPPAFVRDVRGKLEQLDSTTFVLGACAGNDFQHEQKSVSFGPGDVLIAYTDGATEARDQHGRYYGIAGIQRILATGSPLLDHDDGSGGWPGAIRQQVEKHRYGPTADDILVIEIRRPIER